MKRDLYKEVVTNLHLEIQHQFTTVKNYSAKHNIDQFNLSRVFNFKQDISVGLFLKILVDLGHADIKRPEKNWNISLKEYLEINHSVVIVSIMNLQSS